MKFNLGYNKLDWKEVNMTLNGNKINLPKSVTIKFRDKFKIRCIIKREPLLLHIMLKQGLTSFTLASNNPPTNHIRHYRYSFEKMACDLAPNCSFLFQLLFLSTY